MKARMQAGFTLIELMVVVAIVAILAAIALPNYSAYVQRGKIGEAIANLSAMRVDMEQYFLDNRTYVNGPCTTPPTGTYFTYACTATANPDAYTITATGIASQGMNGFTYSIDQANNRKTIAFPNATVPATCWYTKANTC